MSSKNELIVAVVEAAKAWKDIYSNQGSSQYEEEGYEIRMNLAHAVEKLEQYEISCKESAL